MQRSTGRKNLEARDLPARPNRAPGVWAGRVDYRADIVESDDEVTALFDESKASGEQ